MISKQQAKSHSFVILESPTPIGYYDIYAEVLKIKPSFQLILTVKTACNFNRL